MEPLTHDEALRVFNAFLLFARGGVEPAAREIPPTIAPMSAMSAMFPMPSQNPAFPSGTLSGMPSGMPHGPPSGALHGTPSGPPPIPVVRGARVPSEPPRTPTADRSQDTTRVSPLSEALASSVAPLSMHGSPWEETTRERPDVVREMISHEKNLSDTQQSLPVFSEVHVGQRVVEEQSIIVEDEGLTNPEFGRDAFTGPEAQTPAAGFMHAPMPVEQFVQEMAVLIKYGHAGQAASETERWISAHPDDLSAHLRIAEFEMARLDRDAAVNRFVALVARLLERGDQAGAADVMKKLRRDAPDDKRVGALAQRYGR